jgi:hypothetical protein
MTDRFLSRWLHQGVEFGICPLCRASHRIDRRYIWHFFEEGSINDAGIDAFSRARGFCAEHAEQLRRVEVDGLSSTLGISDLYVAALQRLREDLAQLASEDRLRTEHCPACAHRDAEMAAQALHCIPHFHLARSMSRTSPEREMLTAVQRQASHRLIGELSEHVRKQRAEFSHEPKGAEASSWQRAIWLMTGWPAPARPASLPEGENPYHVAGTVTPRRG